MKVLIIDNYDSFTFNLYQLVGDLTGIAPTAIPNDGDWAGVAHGGFDAVIISPGPGRPERERDFGLSRRAIMELTVPVLGVCLGQQGICHLFGGSVVHAAEPMHGRTCEVHHDGTGLFAGVPDPFTAVRYHSLVCAQPLPADLLKTAWTDDGEVMALRHRSRPIWGVQFHPESILTGHGRIMLANFLGLPRLHVRRIAGRPDPMQLFSDLFAGCDHAFWLDSPDARFSFMGGASGDEAETVRYYAAERKLVVQRAGKTEVSGEDVLDYVKRDLAARRVVSPDLPFDFNCGYVGVFGYELKALCGAQSQWHWGGPDCSLLFADRCVAIDHEAGDVYLLGLGNGAEEWFSSVLGLGFGSPAPRNSPACPASNTIFSWRHSRETYLGNIARCLQYIRDGESYEICLTNQLRANFSCDPLAYYQVLRSRNPAPFAAFLKSPEFTVACASPERFLKLSPRGEVESKPIKGTIRRGNDSIEDAELRERLAHDEKNRAENLMIVDLLRNDLGRVCELGSVRVAELMHVETHPTLHQMVSTITGQLRPDQTAVDCFRAAFPGGSMTGAPKLRTLGIIDELEGEARGIYSGSIGYFGLNGAADLNIVIRSAVFAGGEVTIGAGGAIVALSDPEEEWQEVLLKAQALVDAFRQLGEVTFAPSYIP